MEINELPQVLKSLISSEPYDFAVKCGLKRPVIKSLRDIALSLIFIAVSGVFAAIFLNSRKNPSPDTPDSGSDTVMILLLSFFLIFGTVMLVSGIIRGSRRGGYFVGTPKRLIHYKNGKHSSFDWKRFAGETQITGSDRKGTIMLVLRPENLSNGESEMAYVPDVIYMTGISNVFEIERMIRRRMKENDPTPAKMN